VGTTRTGTVPPPPDFQGTAAALRTPRETGALFPDSGPLPARRDSGARRPVAEKRELFPGPRPPSPGSVASPPAVRSRVREGGSRFPFAARSWLPGSRPTDRFAAAAGGLGSTNSRASAVLEKPFSASALRVLAWVVATTTKICTTGRSARARARASPRPARLAYSARPLRAAPAGFEGHARAPSIFGADPLGGYVFTRFLADFDFHDHRPAVATDRRPFRDRYRRDLGPFRPASGSSRIARSAYQNGPTDRPASRPGSARATRGSSPVRSSRIGRGRSGPGTSSRSLYRAKRPGRPLSWGKFRRKPATRRFDWSFAPIRASDERFARQYRRRASTGVSPGFAARTDRSPPFGSRRGRSGSVRLGGVRPAVPPPFREASRPSPSLRGGASRPLARARVRLLGPCYETGRTGPSRRRLRGPGDAPRRPAARPPPRDAGTGRRRPGPARRPAVRAPSTSGPARAPGGPLGAPSRARRGDPPFGAVRVPRRRPRRRAPRGRGVRGERGAGPSLPSPRAVAASERRRGLVGPVRFPLDDFERFWPPFRGSFHLSVAVLVRYRRPPRV